MTFYFSTKPFKFLLCPAVGRLARLGRRPGAVSAEVDVRLGAVLHRAPVHSLVHQARDVRDPDTGRELVHPGGVTALTGAARPAVDDGLRGESEVGELIAPGNLEPVYAVNEANSDVL